MTRCSLGLCLVLAACASPWSEPASAWADRGGYALVNLHPDNERSLLYAVNYQQQGLIPVCSKIEYLGLHGQKFRLRVVSTSREYEYRYHKAAAETFGRHLTRFFGPACPKAEIARLSDIDRQGIRQGVALPGMSRRGVILAMGHPPRHVNPSPDGPSFMYWKSRFNRVEILFDEEGRVYAVRD